MAGIKSINCNYSVTNSGEVISYIQNENGKKLKPEKTRSGYLRMALYVGGDRKKYLLHRLIALAFIPNPKNKPFVNHINGNKTDNRIDNLEWVTAKENAIHSYNNGLQKRKCSPEKIERIKQLRLQGCTYREIAKIENIALETTYRIVNQ